MSSKRPNIRLIGIDYVSYFHENGLFIFQHHHEALLCAIVGIALTRKQKKNEKVNAFLLYFCNYQFLFF